MASIAPRLALAVALLIAASASDQIASARLSQQQLEDIGARPQPGRRMPSLDIRDLDGAAHDIARLIDRPSLIIFADYTCHTLCGPVLAFVGHALTESGLPPDRYRLIVVGLDPKDAAADARRMRDAQLGDGPIAHNAIFVSADAKGIKALTAALGYHFTYDAAIDQFAHPDAVFVFAADGRLARVLSGIGLNGSDMRLALVEAGEGKIGTLTDQVHLLCYGFDPARGTYNLEIGRVLSASALITALGLGGMIGLLTVATRRKAAAPAQRGKTRRARTARR